MPAARSHGTRRGIRPAVAAAVVTTAAALLLAPAAHATTSGTGSTQTATFTTSAQLSITASPVSLGALSGTTAPVGLGSVVVQDTEADSTNWAASVAASNCFPPASLTNVNTAAATVPATALTLNPGSADVSPTAALTTGTPAQAVPAPSSAFPAVSGGTVTAPVVGAPVALAATNASSTTLTSDPYNDDGTYTLSPSLSLNLTGSSFATVPATYTCTLQYTITG